MPDEDWEARLTQTRQRIDDIESRIVAEQKMLRVVLAVAIAGFCGVGYWILAHAS